MSGSDMRDVRRGPRDFPDVASLIRATLGWEANLRSADVINRIEIEGLYSLPRDLRALQAEAALQGFGFLDRLASDWASGANTFDQAGECLLGAFAQGRLVGIGGLNRDPYLARADVARVRHLYVLDEWRRRGLGTVILDRLLKHAGAAFAEVRLRTAAGSAAFYERCGFSPIEDTTATHALRLRVRARSAD